MAFCAVDSFDAITGLLKHMDRHLSGALSAFEVMWPAFYELVTTPPAQGPAPLPHGFAYYVLVEALGAGEEAFAAALEAAMAHGLVADAAVAHSQAEVAAIWALRDDVMQTARFGLPFTFDVSLPIAAKPDYEVAHFNLGSALLRIGAYEEALGHFKEAARLKPGYSEAFFLAGFVLEMQNRIPEAGQHSHPCPEEERWQDRKCAEFCRVAEFCEHGIAITSSQAIGEVA